MAAAPDDAARTPLPRGDHGPAGIARAATPDDAARPPLPRRDHAPAGTARTAAPDDAAQIPLRLVVSSGRRFTNFEVTPENAELVDAVRRIATDRTPRRVLIVGDAGSGKSHLLEAASEAAGARGDAPAFAPMRDWCSQQVEAVRGLGRSGLLCIDDVDAIAGDRRWEEALLALVEASASRRARVLVSAGAAPSHIPFALADLRSRLGAATLYRLHALDDESRARALRRHASGRGIEIPDDVVGYVLTRHRRDMSSLLALLDRLDHHSMAHQRRLTVPFVRGLVEADRAPDGRGAS